MKHINNKGWGLDTMIILCSVLLVAFLIAILLIKTAFFGLLKFNNLPMSQIDKTRTYTSMEVEMIDASKKYVDYNFKDGLKDTIYISVVELQNSKLLNNLYDVKNTSIECSGYVKVMNEDNIIRYQPFMKCGSDYLTNGYISKYDKIR